MQKRVQAVGVLALVVGLLAAVAFASAAHAGQSLHDISLNGGVAWFGERATGSASLIEGSTATRIVRLPVAAAADNVDVVQSGTQSGSGAFVVDRTTGTVRRIDGADLSSGPAVPLGQAGDGQLDVVSNSKATWAITNDGAVAVPVDPISLSPLGPPQLLGDAGSQAVLTPNGSLWTMGSNGTVRSLTGGKLHSRTTPGSPGSLLVDVGGHAVVVDPTAQDALVLGNGGQVTHRVAFDVPAHPVPVVSGDPSSPYLLSVGATDGTLEVIDLRSGAASSVVIGDAGSQTRYGPAVQQDNLAFIPDFQTGEVVVVVLGGHPTVRGRAYVGLDDTVFTLLAHGNHVWFDDPSGDAVGVVSDSLQALTTSKSSGDGVGHSVGPRKASPVTTPPATGPVPTVAGPPVPGLPTTVPRAPTTSAAPATVAPATTTTSPKPPPTSAAVQAPPPTSAAPSSPTTAAAQPTTTMASATPVPDFTWAPAIGQPGQPVVFTDTSTGPHLISGWTFAGGSPGTSNATSPSVVWEIPGTYTVTLTVQNDGNAASTQAQVTVAVPATTVVPTTSPTTSPVTTATTTPTTTPTTAASTTTAPTCTPTPSGTAFSSPGTTAHFFAPLNSSTVDVTVIGASGGSDSRGGGSGGKGANIVATVPVTPCEDITVFVGGAGQGNNYMQNEPGFPGGASAGGFGGGKGGDPGVSQAQAEDEGAPVAAPPPPSRTRRRGWRSWPAGAAERVATDRSATKATAGTARTTARSPTTARWTPTAPPGWLGARRGTRAAPASHRRPTISEAAVAAEAVGPRAARAAMRARSPKRSRTTPTADRVAVAGPTSCRAPSHTRRPTGPTPATVPCSSPTSPAVAQCRRSSSRLTRSRSPAGTAAWAWPAPV